MNRHRAIAALFLGAALAGLAAWLGPLLNPPAIARWTVQTFDEEYLRAAFALVAIRHLPMFLLSVAAGNLIFRMLKNTSPAMVAITALPWLIYVLTAGTLDSVAVGEAPWSWVVYEPAYFIWPHFIAVPAGLFAASSMVKRRNLRRPAPSPAQPSRA